MNKRNFPKTRLKSASVLALGLAALAPLGAATANIVNDGSMENGGAWKSNDSKGSVVSGVARSGKKSVKLIHDGNGNRNQSPTHNVVQSNIGGVSPGKEYVYTVWVKGSSVKGIGGGGKPMSVLRFKNSSGGKLGEEMFMWAPYGTYGFVPLTIHMQAPSGATKIDVGFRAWWDVTGGVSYWDDATLVERKFPNRGTKLATYQAEQGKIGGGAIQKAHHGYTGTGYFKPNNGGGYVEWTNVNGGSNGGTRVISARYAHEGNQKDWELSVNGVKTGRLRPTPTGRVASWATHDWIVNLKPGNNTIRLTAMQYTAGPLIDSMTVYNKVGSGGSVGGGGGGGTTNPPSQPPANTVADPVFTPNGGTHQDSVKVKIKSSTPGATIYYSTNGGKPTQAYGGPFTLTRTATVKAVAKLDGYKNSAIMSKKFLITTGSGASSGRQSPYGGKVRAVPGKIQAEDYDNGGPGVAYKDRRAGNAGGKYRRDDVDIYGSKDVGRGFMVGMAGGEWLEYTVNVKRAGTYTFKARVASKKAGRRLRLESKGVNLTRSVSIPNTGDWQKWATVSKRIKLKAGRQVLRVFAERGSFNLNDISIAK